MSDTVFTNLLTSVPRGEAIIDPRVGDHEGAEFQGAELLQNSTGSWAIVATFGNLRDTEGKLFEHKERYNIPESTSDVAVKRIFLGVLHDLGLVPQEENAAVYAETDEHRRELADAFKSLKGNQYNLRLRPRTDNNAFVRASFIRSRKAA